MDVSFASGVVHAALTRPRGADGTENMASGVVHAALTRPRGADGTENVATGFTTVTTRPRGRGRYGEHGERRCSCRSYTSAGARTVR